MKTEQPDQIPEVSASGHNQYSLTCEVMGHVTRYNTCLWLTDAFVEKRYSLKEEKDLEGNCFHQMECGNCPAMKMREEEIAAGKALYFSGTPPVNVLKREQRVNKTSDSYLKGWARAGGEIVKRVAKLVMPEAGFKSELGAPADAEPKKAKKPSSVAEALKSTVSIADTINASVAASEDVKKALKRKQEREAPMSIVERARQMRLERESGS